MAPILHSVGADSLHDRLFSPGMCQWVVPATHLLHLHFTKIIPNPFNPETEIRFQIPNTSEVTLKIYNLLGQRVRQLVTFGEAGGMIARVVGEALASQGEGERGLGRIRETEALEDAVQAAAKVARPGDVVLLSPGGTSYDAFVDFAARGDRFKELVHAL